MLDKNCSHRKKCKCFDDRSWWMPYLLESAEEEGMTFERMGEIFGTTRMGQCQNTKVAMLKLRGQFDEMGLKKSDFFEGE
jgi:hypothetical protein